MRTSLRLHALTLIVLASLAPSAPAEELAFEDRPAVAAEVLSRMRGGFTATVGGTQFELSFGVERTVTVNGDIVGSTSFRIPSLQQLEALRALPLQAGFGNSIAPDVGSVGSLQVIQNTLDNQVLRQVTTINASVRNLEVFRAAQFGAMLNRQLFMSVR